MWSCTSNPTLNFSPVFNQAQRSYIFFLLSLNNYISLKSNQYHTSICITKTCWLIQEITVAVWCSQTLTHPALKSWHSPPLASKLSIVTFTFSCPAQAERLVSRFPAQRLHQKRKKRTFTFIYDSPPQNIQGHYFFLNSIFCTFLADHLFYKPSEHTGTLFFSWTVSSVPSWRITYPTRRQNIQGHYFFLNSIFCKFLADHLSYKP
jgi:hypothetical protein